MTFANYLINLSLYIWLIFIVFNVGGYFLFRKLLYRKLNYRKIVPLESTTAQHLFELQHSSISNMVFILIGCLIYFMYQAGYTQIYSDSNRYHWIYFIVSFFIIHTLHDTYFYWTHRAMHEVKFLKKFHKAHHRSKVPTPFAALSFSYDEAIIQGLFYVLIAVIMPVHWGMIAFFYLFISWISMWGHTEFEFWPNSLFRFPYASTFNSLTHHNLHHYYGAGNYSLYYRFWDELCGTGHKKTYDHFYGVRKNIEEHFGRKALVLRPKPYDQAGLYFEQLECYGDDIAISFKKIDIGVANCSFQKSELDSVPHSYADGISALKHLHIVDQKLITNYPNINRFRENTFSFEKFVFALKKIIQITSRLPYRHFDIEDNFKNNEKLQSSHLNAISFSLDETKGILNFAKLNDVKLNSVLVNNISEVYSKYCKNILWVIPVWYPEKTGQIESVEIKNNTSFIEFFYNKKMNVKEIDAKIAEVLKTHELWFWSKSFDFLNILLKYPFALTVYFTKKCLRRTGTISNLGSFTGEIEEAISFAPPALENSPISFGILTYNGKLTISAVTHKKWGPSSENSKMILDQIKQRLLNLK